MDRMSTAWRACARKGAKEDVYAPCHHVQFRLARRTRRAFRATARGWSACRAVERVAWRLYRVNPFEPFVRACMHAPAHARAREHRPARGRAVVVGGGGLG